MHFICHICSHLETISQQSFSSTEHWTEARSTLIKVVSESPCGTLYCRSDNIYRRDCFWRAIYQLLTITEPKKLLYHLNSLYKLIKMWTFVAKVVSYGVKNVSVNSKDTSMKYTRRKEGSAHLWPMQYHAQPPKSFFTATHSRRKHVELMITLEIGCIPFMWASFQGPIIMYGGILEHLLGPRSY